jgi:hypothetical protein
MATPAGKGTDRKFKEVVSTEKPPEYGEFYQWTAIGQSVEGTYKSKRKNPARIGNDGQRFKEQSLYDIEGDAGDLWTLNGNFDLDTKFRKVRIGSYVRVTFVSEEEVGSDNRGLAPRRIFKVEVSD